MRIRLAATIALVTIMLAGCRVVPKVETPPTPTATNALSAGLTAGPSIASLAMRPARPSRLRAAMVKSCELFFCAFSRWRL